MGSPVSPPSGVPCHNCRRRRLRCDRSLPQCNKCRKNGRECLGYGQLFRWTGAIASRGKYAGKQTLSADEGVGRDTECRSALVVKASPAPTSVSTSSGSTSEELDELFSLELLRCMANGVNAGDKAIIPPRVLTDPLFESMDYSSRYYISYFDNRLCQDLVAYDLPGRNPFRNLISLTNSQPLLQHIIVATSAAHLSNLLKAPGLLRAQLDGNAPSASPELSASALRDALVSKQRALRLMHIALQDTKAMDRDVLLAAAMFFVNMELIESGKTSWRAHLEGAGQIVALMKTATSSSSALRDSLLSDFMIYFILALAFMQPAAAADLRMKYAEIMPHTSEVFSNSYWSCPPQVLTVLSEASQLSGGEADAGIETTIRGLALLKRAQAIDIRSWAEEICRMPGFATISIQSRLHTGLVHRLAASVYITQAIPAVGRAVGQAASDALTQELLEELSRIPDDDPNFKATTWPTFIAGAQAKDRKAQEWAMDRLRRLMLCCPWGFINTAMEVLQLIWGTETGGKGWIQHLKDPAVNILIV